MRGKNFFTGFILGFTIITLGAGLVAVEPLAAQQPAVVGQTTAVPAPMPAAAAWWYTLERGKLSFRNGSYGDALIAFEDARRGRLAQFTRMENDLILLLSRPDVRFLGDSLDYIERYISENHEDNAASALAELYHRVPRDSLRGSVKRALDELDRLKNYPEAEFWLGETYRAEGEISLAMRQYERAWEYRALLEDPDFDSVILYKITEVHRIRREYQEMEKRANEIIEGPGPGGSPRDTLWAGGGRNLTRSAMARILENEGVGRFLTLYRYNNAVTEKAHRLLGFFCYSSSRYSLAAEHLMFSFLIQNTVLLEEAVRNQYDFSFSSLRDLERFALSKPALGAYLDECEYYRTIYYLASALYSGGKTRPASELWAFLSGSNNAGEWGQRARISPVPYLERAIEMP